MGNLDIKQLVYLVDTYSGELPVSQYSLECLLAYLSLALNKRVADALKMGWTVPEEYF